MPRLSSEFFQAAVSLTTPGPVAEVISQSGFEVCSLELSAGIPNPLAVPRLLSLVRRFKPDIVQTWMYHADLLGGISARLAGIRHVVWNIRNTAPSPATNSASTRVVVSACARLSAYVPTRIVCCARSALEGHVAAGYRRDKFRLIPNGVDLDRFRPDESSRRWLRHELGIQPDAMLVGLIGRFDPAKNHKGFVDAARIIHGQRPDVHFVLAGKGVDPNNRALHQMISSAELGSVIHLLGDRPDVPRLNQGLDLAISTSIGEAFPNVLAEAMACGTPVAATDAGDARLILGETGPIVVQGDLTGFAQACLGLLAMPMELRRELGMAARRRIAEHFSIDAAAAGYNQLYRDILHGERPGPA